MTSFGKKYMVTSGYTITHASDYTISIALMKPYQVALVDVVLIM